MTTGLTPSEVFVATLCQRSFLKLWTHPNPIGKKGKELCDCLIVCGAHVIIISVKDIEFKDTGDQRGWERWHKAAIEKSASQILGAERWLNSVTQVSRRDGRKILLPAQHERKYHRVSVSLGGRGEVPLQWGDFGSGFIHVCDEYSLGVLFNELDTITDFIDFLSATEALIVGGTKPVFSGGGLEDLLALYIQNGNTFGFPQSGDTRPNIAIVTDGIWMHYKESAEYKARSNDLRNSYVWDRLIEHFTDDLLADGIFDLHSKQVTKNELALVAMALQPRGHRANLADALLEFFNSSGSRVTSRAVVGANATAFVFLAGKSSDRGTRIRELALRCLVIRGRYPGITTVVGIATDRPGTSEIGYSSDIAYVHMTSWTPEDEATVVGIQRDLGYFKNANWSKQA
jgi:hypothetical protein